MAEAIGAIRIDLGLNSAQFQTGLKQASGSLSSFAANATKIGAAIGVALAGAMVGVGHALSGALDSADKLGKMAQSVGVPVEELSALSLAAKLSDVSLESLGTSLGKLSKNMVAAAADSTGKAAMGFNALGLSVRNADGTMKSSSAMLGEIATKFAGYEDGVNKTALAMALFGKAGAAMIPMLNGGKDAIEEAKKEAEQFGMVITPQMFANAEAFNDNITRLGAAAGGFATVLAGELAPWLKAVTDQFVIWVKESDGVGTAVEWIKSLLQGLIEFVIQTKGEFQALGAVLTWIGTLGSQIKENARLSEVADEFNNMTDRVKGFRDATQGALETMRTLTITAAKVPSSAPKPQAPGIPDSDKTKKGADEAAKALKKLQAEAKAVYEATRTPAEKLTDQLAHLQTLLAAGQISWDTYGRAVQQAHDKYDQSWITLKDISGTLESGLNGMFDGLIDGSKNAVDAIKDLGKNMLKLVMNKAISSLMGGLFGNSGGGLGAMFSGLLGGGGAAPNLGGFFAAGGNFAGGKPIVVGERGPEIITPRMAGTVIPNHELGGRGGSSVNIVVENHGGQVEQQRETGADGGEQIRMIFRSLMSDEIGRNGPVAQMLQGRYGLNRSGGRR